MCAMFEANYNLNSVKLFPTTSIVQTLQLPEPFSDYKEMAAASVIDVKYERRVEHASRSR